MFLAHVLGWMVAGAGSLILAGWIADVPLLRSLLPQQVEAKANTAVCFILAGVALALKTRRLAPNAANFFAAFATAIGLGTLGEYLFGWNPGLDELLFRDSATAAYTVHPGRMAPPTALCFVLLGTALLLLKAGRHRIAVAWLAVPAAILATLGFVGQLYDLPFLTSFGPYTPIAAPTGITFLLLSMGALLTGSCDLVARIRHSGRAIGLAAAVILLLVMGGAVVRNTYALIDNNHQVNHTHEVLGRLGGVLSAVQDVETGSRGYVLTGDQRFLEHYEAAPAALKRLQLELRELTRDNPAQHTRLDLLQNLITTKLSISQANILMRQQGNITGAQAEVAAGRGREQMLALRQVLNDLRREENRLLEIRRTQVDASTLRTLLTLGSGLVITIGLLVTIFTLLHREIARRAQVEAALRHSEEDLAVTLNSIGDAVLTTDTTGRITRMNRMAEELTGWKRAEARGRPIAEVFRIINEESRAPAPIPVDEVLATGEIRQLMNHTALIARDGTERAIADSAAPIRDPDGRVLGVVLVFRDVTESRRKAEDYRRLNAELQRHTAQLEAANAELEHSRAELKSLFESLPGLYLILTPDYRIVAVSDAYLQATLTERAAILGRGLFEVFPDNPDDPRADGVRNLRASLERVAAQGAPDTMAIQKYDVRRPDGAFEEKYWSPINSPLFGAEGRLRYIIHRVEDVTEFARRKAAPDREGDGALRARLEQMEAEVFRSSQKTQAVNDQLRAANQELEAFSYSVSHDLRAPLRHVQGYVEMLTHEAGSQLSDKARRYLRTITDAAREMGQLIDDLLAFSRMSRTEMQETTVDLAALIQEIRQQLERATPGRNIRWNFAPLPKVRADAAMLRQVLINLLDNAVKYTRPRNPAEIEVGCAGEEEGRIICYVRDNGAGFDMKYAGKLFGVFQRLHRTDEFEGTGIGLATVRRTISRHGGRTWAEAHLDAGATFYFTLAPAPAGPALTPART